MASLAPVPALVQPDPAPTSPDRVLVVDDESAIVAVETEILRAAGYDAVGVLDPQEALDLVADGFDVLVTDYRMPEINGLRLFQSLRAVNPEIVGVLVTGFGNLQLVQTAMRSGFTAILLKPFPLDRLSAAVERALRQQRLAAENHRLEAVLSIYRIGQDLNRPMQRNELADLLGQLALDAVGAATAGVLLVEHPPGVLRKPYPTRVAVWPAATDALLDRTPEQAHACWPRAADPGRWYGPLMLGETMEGVLLVERVRPFDAAETERLSLLAQQGALALSHVRLFGDRLRDEKLELVGQMAGAICDRVRRPVATILDTAASIEVDEADYLAMITENAARLTSMCGEMADFVTGEFRLERRPASLRSLLEDAVRHNLPAYTRQGIKVRLETAQDLVLSIDQRRLLRALQNLVKNAVEAMPQGGQLILALRLSDTEAVLEVADSGCGMPPEVLAHVFDPFFTHGKKGGTGLGGAVVRSAVAAHGGRAEVQSTVGQGTTFRLILPRAEAEETADA